MVLHANLWCIASESVAREIDEGKAYYVTHIAWHISKLLLEKLRYAKATSFESEEAACDSVVLKI